MLPEKRTPDMYEMAYKIAKTEKLEDIEKIRADAREKGKEEAKKETLESAQELHAASTPRSGAPKETKTSVRLSPDEEKMAARYGMSKEDYAKWKANSKISQPEKATRK
jgi:phage I-like protein